MDKTPERVWIRWGPIGPHTEYANAYLRDRFGDATEYVRADVLAEAVEIIRTSLAMQDEYWEPQARTFLAGR